MIGACGYAYLWLPPTTPVPLNVHRGPRATTVHTRPSQRGVGGCWRVLVYLAPGRCTCLALAAAVCWSYRPQRFWAYCGVARFVTGCARLWAGSPGAGVADEGGGMVYDCRATG